MNSNQTKRPIYAEWQPLIQNLIHLNSSLTIQITDEINIDMLVYFLIIYRFIYKSNILNIN